MISGSISAPYIIPLRSDQTQQFLIDTNTLIEIGSQSSDVDIYYTLDGSKPDAFITVTARRSTIQYRKPFYIPREIANAGNVTVKAIAVSRNGIRESAVIAKTFDIRIVPSDHAQSDEYENRYLYELQQERQELMRRIHEDHEERVSDSISRMRANSFSPDASSHYANVIPQRSTEVLQCAHCFAPKTTDLYTRFCTSCGRPWEKLTKNQPNNYSTNICAKCKSIIPVNSDRCQVCEIKEPLEPPSLRPKISNQSTIVCPHCKSANPVHLRACYICESALIPTSTPQMRASVSVPILTEPLMTCSKCLRVNHTDARFCDWCGAHPEKVLTSIQCTKCRATNGPTAKFCTSCGCVLETPARNHFNGSTSSVIASTLTRPPVNPAWSTANVLLNQYQQPTWITKGEAATQTSGISYPSAKDVDLLIAQNKQLQEDQTFKEHHPVLTPVSPGKGYWKQQIDHVCAHLKAFAVNRQDFRALIGQPRMGKMIHATVQETERQIIVQTIFQKPENLSQSTVFLNRKDEHYPIHLDRSSPLSSAFNSDDEYTREKSHRKKAKKRAQSSTILDIDSPNHALIKLLERKSGSSSQKKSSHTDIFEEVRRLIKEKKANANFRNKDDYTPLQLAVRNKHFECIETLIKDGEARLDKKGPRGTTALHECCLLGYEGVQPLRILLEHGGDVTWVNDKKESVVDLASKQNCRELLEVIASTRGQQMVNRQEHNIHVFSSNCNFTAMALFILHEESRYSSIHIQQNQDKRSESVSSPDIDKSYKQSLLLYIPQVSIHCNQLKAFDTDDHKNKLIKQTNTVEDEESILMTDDSNLTDKFVQQNPLASQIYLNASSTSISETSEIRMKPTSVSLKDLLSYQDVMKAIEREFHLHDGQEREIIMKLWLKGQAMISILQRFRHLFQDLNIDDKDFVEGIKQIREMINYAHRDIHYLSEQTSMLENQNHFLESEFQRQLDKIVQEKNEQISRLMHIIDQSCTKMTTDSNKEYIEGENQHSATEELLKKFKQENVELQREIETLRAKLEYTFTFVNEKLDQQKVDVTTSSTSIIQTAFEQLHHTENILQELKLKSAAQQEENDLLKYLLEKCQQSSDVEQTDFFGTIEQRSLNREIDRVRHELELTEQKAVQLEQRFESSDENVQFHMEKLKLKCDILRKHVLTCTQRLDNYNEQIRLEFRNERQTQKNNNSSEDSVNQKKILDLEKELTTLRERYNELLEHSNTMKLDLYNARKQLHENEKAKFESNSIIDTEHESQRLGLLENELKFLKSKYDDACVRMTTGTQQLESLQIAFEQTSRRCEQLEEEKMKIDLESKSVAKNVANVTAKYKNKLHTIKSRLEQTERERRELQNLNEKYQHEIEHLRNDLINKKEILIEKEQIIHDIQYKNVEILMEKQLIEERVSNESKRFNEIIHKNNLLEIELERIRQNEMSENLSIRRTEANVFDSSVNNSLKYIEELKSKINECEQSLGEEKASKESLQVQIKILEEENADLREIMNQMRKRTQDDRNDERDRNIEIQQLIARTELNARQYMANFNFTTLLTPSALVKIVPLTSSTTIS
ncbi:hypothetical protein I4U23_024913 [Adineta vaga]|nr:hypothetical protein I4U23_024913 [Adineta vaga]